ncbi:MULTISPECIES: site-specific DNA-methyltransferase [unclassified Mesorhizobium]|uniref:site-specific DNA-methyltransferase n=1 Tax=unclassified Mesorhizobium TaxID=325217 RepID=UPI00112C0099|nr:MULTISPECIES: site-specific DNA-methyltransferase [unclassified Mesorhizobium]TPK96543.1 site-specific DNA-methyltransferase [Mesorhizobium sp. B2-4-16]TPL62428.1 site-specific DNA-methyltransferase [Mesorhizobium sp. B2-4-3]
MAGTTSTAYVRFEEWTGRRDVPTLGTNTGAPTLPFQGWRRFKEAFAPELVRMAIEEVGNVQKVIDPFGGSGTTALAAQFLGARPSTIEVNPFLADLIEAKICRYEIDKVVSGFTAVVDKAYGKSRDPAELLLHAPPTFIEPGVAGRYLFSKDVAARFCAYRSAIGTVEDLATRRLLGVLLGATAVPASNALVSGKGRRYRRRWKEAPINPDVIDTMFEQGVLSALFDLRRFEARRCCDYEVLRGDARIRLTEVEPADIAIFSPPYPNSFDYTDVYNIELWMMGYLNSAKENRELRKSTLRSHVQIKRDLSAARPASGSLLEQTLKSLEEVRAALWDQNIPPMIAAYFDDVGDILKGLSSRLRERGRVYMVVGDSRYAGIDVPVAAILAEQAESWGFELVRSEPFRSMRASPQQGGGRELSETLVVLARV